jgi:hypothetical protein
VAQRAGTTRRQTEGEPAARLARWALRGVTLLGASAASGGLFASQSRPAAAMPAFIRKASAKAGHPSSHLVQIRYVQRIYAPEEQRCLWLFETAGLDLVRAVNDIAQFPLARVIAVLSAAPGGSSPIADVE